MPILDFIGGAVDFAKSLVDRIAPEKMSDSERSLAVLEVEKMIAERETSLITASKEVMIAELQQSDNFTKRARPMIIYAGLVAIGINHVLVPLVNRVMEWIVLLQDKTLDSFALLSPMTLPTEFWATWGMVASVYALGRTAEKRGVQNKLVGWITGNKSN